MRRGQRSTGDQAGVAGSVIDVPEDGNRPPQASAFISYAREDVEVIRRLHVALESRGREAWVDWADIYPSADWWEEIRRAIQASDAMVFAISPDSIASRVCLREVQDAAAAGKRLIPVVVRRVPSADVPEPLRRHNWISFQSEDEFEASLDRLTDALDADFEWMRDHTRLLGRAVEWDGGGRDRSRLLRGRDLELSERWITRAAEHAEPRPTPLQADYILASRRAATRGQRRALAGLGIVGVAILSLAIVALVQRGEAERQAAVAAQERDIADTQRQAAEERARVARSRELAAAAERQLALDPELGLLLAIEAVNVAETNESGTALRDAIESSRVRQLLPTEPDSRVSSLTWDPAGRWIVGLHEDGTISIWDRSEASARTIAQGLTNIDAIAIGAGGVLLAQGQGINAVFLDTGRIQPLSSLWPAEAGLASPAPVLVGWNDSFTKVLLRSGSRLALLEVPTLNVVGRSQDLPDAARARLSHDATQVAVWTGKDVEVRRIATGAIIGTIAVGAPIVDVEFTTGSDLVLITTSDGAAGTWDTATGRPVGALEGGVDRNASDLVIDRTGRFVAAGSSGSFRGGMLGFDTGGRVRVWDLETGRIVSIVGSSSQPVDLHSFMPDGERVVTIGTGAVQIWDLRTSVQLASLRGQVGSTVALAVSPDGRQIVTADQLGRVRVWDADTDEALMRLGRFPLIEGRDETSWPILEMAQTADGRHLAFGVGAQKAITWDWTDAGFHEVAEDRVFAALALRSDGAVLATAELLGPDDGAIGTMVRLWPTDRGLAPLVCRIADATSRPSDIAFSPDGTRLAIASGDGWRIVHAGNGCPTEGRALTGDGFRVLSLQFDPTGRILYSTGRPGFVDAWDAATGDPIWSIVGHQFGAIDLAISPDGMLIATAGLDDVVRVWKASDGSPVHELRGHGDWVHAVTFSPDGTWLVSGSADRAALVWEVATGRLLDRLTGSTDEIRSVAIGPDRRIATGGMDGFLRVYECHLCIANDELEALGRSRVTRELSAEERRAFLRE